ncbi:hypothetical protein [Nocardia sp. NPDC056100]|uniref:DUF7691 family protein n=1 Tax=Nocardia sp. NPDC056100 TaxID=3345712 RepID=UPI0035E25AC2
MGWFFQAYAVDLDQAHGAIGSGDDELLRRVEQKFEDELDDDEELAEVVRYVVSGTLDDGDDLEDYFVEAFKMICETLSVLEEGNGPFSSDWPGAIDTGLSELNIDSIRFREFEGGKVLTFPDGIEYARIYGEWTHTQCVAAVERWEGTTAEQRLALDPEVLDWVEIGIRLASMAAKTPGYGVAGFIWM